MFAPHLICLGFLADGIWLTPAVAAALILFTITARMRLLSSRRWLDDDNGEPITPMSGEADRRTSRRRSGAYRRVLVFGELNSGIGGPVEGAVMNLSAGGLLLTMETAAKEGAFLRIRPFKAPDDAAWTLVQVRNARRTRGVWELGCRFVDCSVISE